MIHILKTLFAIILAVLLTLGAVYNRQDAPVSLGPLSDDFTLPVYLLVYSALFAGFVLGVAYGWLHYGPIGRWSRSWRKKKKENADNKQDASSEDNEPSTFSERD